MTQNIWQLTAQLCIRRCKTGIGTKSGWICAGHGVMIEGGSSLCSSCAECLVLLKYKKPGFHLYSFLPYLIIEQSVFQ